MNRSCGRPPSPCGSIFTLFPFSPQSPLTNSSSLKDSRSLTPGSSALSPSDSPPPRCRPAGEVLTQAERYSRGIQQQPRFQGEYGVPFLYSTNGEQIWFHDVRREHNRSRWVARLPHARRAERDARRDFDAELATLAGLIQNARLRPYQVEANAAIEQAIAERKRKMLVAMATGTGKTLTTVNEIYRLMKSGVARRVLFLVDRRALAAQAVRAFASFEAEPGLKFDKIYEVYSPALPARGLRRRRSSTRRCCRSRT